jgi:hypothetical protein
MLTNMRMRFEPYMANLEVISNLSTRAATIEHPRIQQCSRTCNSISEWGTELESPPHFYPFHSDILLCSRV